MTEKIVDGEICVYRSSAVEMNSPEQIEEEISFLRKAFGLKMYNTLRYENSRREAFDHMVFDQRVIGSNLELCLAFINSDIKDKQFPSRYVLGMSAALEDGKLDTEYCEKFMREHRED